MDGLAVEEDGDEIFTPISAGCFGCKIFDPGAKYGRNTPLQLVDHSPGVQSLAVPNVQRLLRFGSNRRLTMQFTAFPKIGRLSKLATVTEKIDGTNAAVVILPIDENAEDFDLLATGALATLGGFHIGAQSRSRLLDASAKGDNFGFAKWVLENAPALITLGPGVHFGEWWGAGIQRGYGLTMYKNGMGPQVPDRRFSLFNAARWGAHNPNTPACCSVVPILGRRPLDEVDELMTGLRTVGSVAAPGFMNPEGIVIYYEGTMYKKTFEHDKGKWTEELKSGKWVQELVQ